MMIRVEDGEKLKTMKNKLYALGRLKAGTMNQTEKRYAERLEKQKLAGEVLWYAFEPANLKLAPNCYYRIDFLVMAADGSLEVHEVKGGFITDDALVKIKTAAEKFPFRFLIMQWKSKQWEKREF